MDQRKPKIIEARSRTKYDWETLREQGWIFVPQDDDLLNQAASIRNSASASGFSVSVQRAEADQERGFLVTLR